MKGRLRLWLREVRRRFRRARHGILASLHEGGSIRVRWRADWPIRVHPDGYDDLRYWLSYEAATLAALADTWRAGCCIVDVGAHHGSFSVSCLKGGGHDIRLLAVEPSPAAWPILAANLAVHPADVCTLHRTAVGRRCGTATLYPGVADMLVGAPSLHPVESAKALSVQMVTLDVLCREQGVTPDIIKIDVEGFEDHVLEGGSATLAARPAILLEWHRAMLETRGVDPLQVVRQLEGLGYQFQLTSDIAAARRRPVRADTLPAGDILRLLCRTDRSP